MQLKIKMKKNIKNQKSISPERSRIKDQSKGLIWGFY